MKVKDIMSTDVACCTPGTRLPEVAKLMVDYDCGEIPVIETSSRRPIGVVTDRDIVVRVVAQNGNPLELTARDGMTSPCVTVTPETSLDECLELMERHRIRRIPVVDESGATCGMVSQADIARHASKGDTAKVVKKVSEPTAEPANVGH
jgi:CBS domain-containing protein